MYMHVYIIFIFVGLFNTVNTSDYVVHQMIGYLMNNAF
jgi:hypothetical protein